MLVLINHISPVYVVTRVGDPRMYSPNHLGVRQWSSSIVGIFMECIFLCLKNLKVYSVKLIQFKFFCYLVGKERKGSKLLVTAEDFLRRCSAAQMDRVSLPVQIESKSQLLSNFFYYICSAKTYIIAMPRVEIFIYSRYTMKEKLARVL